MKLAIDKTKHAMHWKKRAIEELGYEKAEILLNNANQLYEEFCIKHHQTHNDFKGHSENVIFPLIAIYKSLIALEYRKGYEHQIVEKWFFESVMMQANTLKGFLKMSNSAKDFPTMFKSEVEKNFSQDSGFELEKFKSDLNKVSFHITKCPYLTLTTKYECRELCASFCQADHLSYCDVSPDINWLREHTLFDSGKYCDFLIAYHPNKQNKGEKDE